MSVRGRALGVFESRCSCHSSSFTARADSRRARASAAIFHGSLTGRTAVDRSRSTRIRRPSDVPEFRGRTRHGYEFQFHRASATNASWAAARAAHARSAAPRTHRAQWTPTCRSSTAFLGARSLLLRRGARYRDADRPSAVWEGRHGAVPTLRLLDQLRPALRAADAMGDRGPREHAIRLRALLPRAPVGPGLPAAQAERARRAAVPGGAPAGARDGCRRRVVPRRHVALCRRPRLGVLARARRGRSVAPAAACVDKHPAVDRAQRVCAPQPAARCCAPRRHAPQDFAMERPRAPGRLQARRGRGVLQGAHRAAARPGGPRGYGDDRCAQIS